MIGLKRVCDPATSKDGSRFLVENLWPRGIEKPSLSMAGWVRDAARGRGLRRWFGHDLGERTAHAFGPV